MSLTYAPVEEEIERRQMSREEFESLPEGPPFYDYVDGVCIKVNRPDLKHQRVQGKLWNYLSDYVEFSGLGLSAHEIDVQLPNGNWYGPDIVFVSSERLQLIDKKGDLRGAPDLAVEILSPSNQHYDRYEKLPDYQRNRVPWVWLIARESLTIEEYRWTPDEYVLVSTTLGGQIFKPELFPGLEIDLAALIAPVRSAGS